MRHGHKTNHLSRKAPHRKAMLANMASSLIVHKRINTTLAKAKELRKYVEPLITKAKNDTTHSRRVVFSYLKDKYSVKELFDDVAERVATRPGGYTRILKTGNRLGDNAEMCIIELVDYNELMLESEESGKAKTRRSRRSRRGSSGSSKQKKEETQQASQETETSAATEEPSVEEVKEEKPSEPEVNEEKSEEVEASTEESEKSEETKKEDETSEKPEDKDEDKKD